MGVTNATTGHRARSSMRPAKAGSKSTSKEGTVLVYDALHVIQSRTLNGIVNNSQNLYRRKPGRHRAANQENYLQLRQRGRQPECRPSDRTDYGTASGSARGFAQHHSQQLSRAAVSLWRRAEHQQRCSQHMRVAHSFMTGLNCPIPMTIGWRPDPFGSTVELGSVAMAAQMRTQEIKCFATTFRG